MKQFAWIIGGLLWKFVLTVLTCVCAIALVFTLPELFGGGSSQKLMKTLIILVPCAIGVILFPVLMMSRKKGE